MQNKVDNFINNVGAKEAKIDIRRSSGMLVINVLFLELGADYIGAASEN